MKLEVNSIYRITHFKDPMDLEQSNNLYCDLCPVLFQKDSQIEPEGFPIKVTDTI